MFVIGWSDVCLVFFGYRFSVSYAGEGGRHFQVEGEEAFLLLHPSPFRPRIALSNPLEEDGSTGQLSVVLARSPVVGGVWMQRR